MSIRSSFQSADIKNPALVYQDNIVSNQEHINPKIKHSSCCQFIPTHIDKKIKEASPEVIREHLELVSEYKLSKLKVSSVSAEPQEHKLNKHLSIFDWQIDAPAPSIVDKSETLQLLYDARQGTALPGRRVKTPKGNIDQSVSRAFEGAKATYQFYFNVLQRDSINGKGMNIISTVNYGYRYNNAMWNGYQMIYGDGDGVIFDDFTKDIDVMGHELTHGVNQYTANLRYRNQSGALNESISDVFATCMKQYHLKQTWKDADWLIGKVCLLGPGALRSLKAPGTAYNTRVLGKDPQPGSMDYYNNTTQDNGGVHINSGIPNRAFYLVCEGMEGNSYDKPAAIWYSTLTSGKLSTSANFTDFANLTIEKAGELYGKDSAEQKNVIYAWNEVKVKANVGPSTLI